MTPERHPADEDHGSPVTATEEFVGQRDLTRWSRPVQPLVEVALRLSRYVSARGVLVATAVVGIVITLLLTWVVGELYASIKSADGLSSLDEPVLELAISRRTPRTIAAAQILTHLGGPVGLTIITAAVVTAMMLRWKSWTPLVLLAVGTAGSLLMTGITKDLVGRARPPIVDAVPPYETSPSFPSGHALNNTVVACLVAYLLLLHLSSLVWRIVSVASAVVWFVSVGLTRVFLGYHWLTDVVAGWLLGLAWTTVVITSHRLYLTVRRVSRSQIVGPGNPSPAQQSPMRSPNAAADGTPPDSSPSTDSPTPNG